MRNIFIDCGARHGQDIYNFRNLFEQRYETYAFECLPENLEQLEKVPDITIIDKAVSTKDGTATFNLGVTTYSGSLRDDKTKNMDPGKSIQVETINFSNWIKENFTSDDNIILSMDIEGSEYEVLYHMIDEGTIKLIDKLYVEFHATKIKNITKPMFMVLKDELIDIFGKNVYIQSYYQNEEFDKLNYDGPSKRNMKHGTG